MFRFRQDSKDLGLQGQRDFSREPIFVLALGQEFDSMCAPVFFVRFALDKACCFHPFEERSDGVWITADKLGKLPLAESASIFFQEGSQDGELVGGNAEMGDAAAKSLVDSIPGSPEQGRQPSALWRIHG